MSIVDVGARDTSSVYHYFDPDMSHRSMGTFSALVELAWSRTRGGRYHYFGLYVSGCPSLSYKDRFKPHERSIDGRWVNPAMEGVRE